MQTHPNRMRNPVNVDPDIPALRKQFVITLTPEQYAKIEAKFPIDQRGDASFQLGVQAVLKVLRDGFTSGA